MYKIGIAMSAGKTQTYINTAYLEWIRDAGTLVPVMLTEHDCKDSVIASLSGLILPGGIDVDPIHYGYDNYNSYDTDPAKDEFERTLFHMFRKAEKPIFGVCRGFQLIAREYMLNFQDAEKVMEFVEHISYHNQVDGQKLERTQASHFVSCRKHLLYDVPEAKEAVPMSVNSMHHQCLVVKQPKKNPTLVIPVTVQETFVPIAWTERGLKDSDKNIVVCEAYEIKNWGAPILCVQWHPEELADSAVIKRFFQNALSKKPAKEPLTGKATVEGTAISYSIAKR